MAAGDETMADTQSQESSKSTPVTTESEAQAAPLSAQGASATEPGAKGNATWNTQKVSIAVVESLISSPLHDKRKLADLSISGKPNTR